MAKEETRWRDLVMKEQQLYYEMLGDRDWDCYKQSEITFLERNIGHAMFGPPKELPDENQNGNTGYNEDNLKEIRKVVCVIKEHSKCPPPSREDDVLMSVVFVCLRLEDKSVPVPVFRIPHHQTQGGIWFVDTYYRVYESWEGYLENNCLPKCEYCYPVGGIYNGDDCDRVLVQFGKTPACSVKNKVYNVLDTASTVASVGGMAVTVAGLFMTVAAPVAVASAVGAVATGVYGVGRSAAALADRGKHKQSVGIDDADSRGCWLSLAGNSLCIASTQAIRSVTSMAQKGKVLSSAGRLLVNAINFSSLAVNGLSLVNNLVVLSEKARRNELRPLDVFQFTSSVLFFTMSAVNMKTANTIIRETQDNVIGDYEASLRSNRHRRQFRRIVRDTRGKDGNSIQGNAKVIRGITQISDKDNFFAGLVRVRSQVSKTDSKVVLTDAGLVEINGELHVHPMRFWEINKQQREFILGATKNLNQGVWTQEHFNQEFQSACPEHNLTFMSQHSEQMPSTSQTVKSNVEMSLHDGVVNHVPMSKQMCQFAIEHRREILNIAKNLAEMMGYHKTAEIIKISDFLANYVEQVTTEVEAKYQEDLAAAERAQGRDFNREKFDMEYNIQGNRRDHFINTVLINYNTYQTLNVLKASYSKLVSEKAAPSDTWKPDFEPLDQIESLKHFTKEHRIRIIHIAMNICDMMGLRSYPILNEVIEFVASYVEKYLSELDVKYKESVKEDMHQEGENFSLKEFDKKHQIEGDKRNLFVTNIISKFDDYGQLKNLKTAYQESCLQPGPSEEMSLYCEKRDFKKQGELTDQEMFNIAQELTGLYLFEGNTTLLRDGAVAFVTINDPHIEPVTIMFHNNIINNSVNATIIT